MIQPAKIVREDGRYRVEYAVRRCQRCVLSNCFPDISFDAAGVCSYCTAPEVNAAPARKGLAVLRDQIRNGDGEVDIVHLLSGGKDSTFALTQLVEAGFRVVAMTYDNDFIAPEAVRNIEMTAALLGVECVVRSLDVATTRSLMREGLMGRDNADALKYSTATCGICISTVLTLGAHEARSRGVKYLSGGWTPGQFTHESIVPGDFLRQVCEGHFDTVVLRNPQMKAKLAKIQLTETRDYPSLFNPLYVIDYQEAVVLNYLEQIGWIKPEGTDSCSTNCLLNGYLVIDHVLRYGFHPYEYELAHHVRTGRLARSEALEKIENVSVSDAAVNEVVRRLTLDGIAHTQRIRTCANE